MFLVSTVVRQLIEYPEGVCSDSEYVWLEGDAEDQWVVDFFKEDENRHTFENFINEAENHTNNWGVPLVLGIRTPVGLLESEKDVTSFLAKTKCDSVEINEIERISV